MDGDLPYNTPISTVTCYFTSSTLVRLTPTAVETWILLPFQTTSWPISSQKRQTLGTVRDSLKNYYGKVIGKDISMSASDLHVSTRVISSHAALKLPSWVCNTASTILTSWRGWSRKVASSRPSREGQRERVRDVPQWENTWLTCTGPIFVYSLAP